MLQLSGFLLDNQVDILSKKPKDWSVHEKNNAGDMSTKEIMKNDMCSNKALQNEETKGSWKLWETNI